ERPAHAVARFRRLWPIGTTWRRRPRLAPADRAEPGPSMPRRRAELSVPLGLPVAQSRRASVAIGEAVEEREQLDVVLCLDQLAGGAAARIAHQLPVEGMDEPVDGQHLLARRAVAPKLLDEALVHRDRSAAEQVLALVRPHVVSPPRAPAATGAGEYLVIPL